MIPLFFTSTGSFGWKLSRFNVPTSFLNCDSFVFCSFKVVLSGSLQGSLKLLLIAQWCELFILVTILIISESKLKLLSVNENFLIPCLVSLWNLSMRLFDWCFSDERVMYSLLYFFNRVFFLCWSSLFQSLISVFLVFKLLLLLLWLQMSQWLSSFLLMGWLLLFWCSSRWMLISVFLIVLQNVYSHNFKELWCGDELIIVFGFYVVFLHSSQFLRWSLTSCFSLG